MNRRRFLGMLVGVATAMAIPLPEPIRQLGNLHYGGGTSTDAPCKWLIYWGHNSVPFKVSQKGGNLIEGKS